MLGSNLRHRCDRSAPGLRRAFTLIDLCVVVATLGIVLALAAAGLAESRRSAQAQFCSAKMGLLGQGSARFALAHQDLFAGLTWQVGGNNSTWADLNALQAQSAMDAHSAQAIDIMRRGGAVIVPAISSWLPHVFYWSMPLGEFEGRPLEDDFNLCPSDDNRNKWRRHREAFYAGQFQPYQPYPGGGVNKRWPHSSSYTITASAWDPNQSIDTPAAIAARLHLGERGPHNLPIYTPPGYRAGPSAMSMVALPALKVHAFDTEQRHGGHRLNHAYPQATQPLLFFDGSVRTRAFAQARLAWLPPMPHVPRSTKIMYEPRAWEAPLPGPGTVEGLNDRLIWTRDGLRGWDY